MLASVCEPKFQSKVCLPSRWSASSTTRNQRVAGGQVDDWLLDRLIFDLEEQDDT
jgi:hypothetical protein